MATRSTGRGDLPRISGLVGGGAGWDLVPRYSSVRARDPLPGQCPQSQLCAGPGPSAWSASPVTALCGPRTLCLATALCGAETLCLVSVPRLLWGL